MTEQTVTDPQLSPRQAEAWEFIRANAGMYSVTIRELCQSMGISSPNGVIGHLKALERAGLIRRHPKKARGIEVLHEPQ